MPRPPDALESRLTAVESAAAHQELATEDLSEQIARQWSEIDRLTRAIERLERRLSALDARVGDEAL